MSAVNQADSILPSSPSRIDVETPQQSTNEDEKNGSEEVDLQSLPKQEPNQYKTKSNSLDAKGSALAFLAFQAIGVVYGDIGTSPLYVLNGIFSSSGPAPSKEDVIGVTSVIVWLFTIVVVVKYALIVLQFGTGMGEGGTFALYQGLFPRSFDGGDDDDDGRQNTTYKVAQTQSLGGLTTHTFDRRSLLLRYSWIKPVVCAWALFGSGLTIADGIITPAVSVVSAAEGIAVVQPDQTNNIRPIAIAILISLIFIQSIGIKKLSLAYSPIVFSWFAFLFLTGIYNCHLHPGIWRAWDPSRAVLYFVRTGNYDALSGALLAVTGCEALFANLGQLGQRAIQLPLIFVVYPSLMLAYLGQGAKLIDDGPNVISNIFYLSIPGPTGGAVYWIGFITGLLATIIASQAMLTACFSIVSQLVHLKSFPSVSRKFPSNDYGQCYIPTVNYALGIAIVAVVAGFATSANLINAYGFAVATVMIVTTVEVALSIYFVKKLPMILGIVFFLAFGFVDCLVWGSTFQKIPKGAWFSLGVGSLLTIFMCLWTWLTGLLDRYDQENRLVLNNLIEESPTTNTTGNTFQRELVLSGLDGVKRVLPRADMFAIFWKPSSGNGVPHSFSHFLTKYPSCPSVVIFLSVVTLAVPSIEWKDAVIVRRVRRYPGFYTATLRQGYKDRVQLPQLNEEIAKAIQALERDAGHTPKSIEEITTYLTSIKHTMTHIYPSYYPAARLMSSSLRSCSSSSSSLDRNRPLSLLVSPMVVAKTCIDYIRAFLIEDIYRRLKGAFAEEDGPFDAREEVIRVVVTAVV